MVQKRQMSLINSALWQIESHMADDLSLGVLAERLGVTPYHLSRAFRARTGETVMGYLRARRLSHAATLLAAGQGSVIQIALDAGYGSHEAFTRAFTRHFGCAPSTVRRSGWVPSDSLKKANAMEISSKLTLPKPQMRQSAERSVIGLAQDHTIETIAGIPALWGQFNARLHELDRQETAPTLGVCYNKSDTGGFRYMAGAEVQPGASTPTGMERTVIPAGSYAVFTYSDHLSGLPDFIGALWDHGLTDAGLAATNAPDFELYDQRMNPSTGEGECEIWIPV